jgi:hypothetical protein
MRHDSGSSSTCASAQPKPINEHDGVRTLEVVDACYRSVASMARIAGCSRLEPRVDSRWFLVCLGLPLLQRSHT